MEQQANSVVVGNFNSMCYQVFDNNNHKAHLPFGTICFRGPSGKLLVWRVFFGTIEWGETLEKQNGMVPSAHTCSSRLLI